MHEIIEQEIGEISDIFRFKVRTTESIADAILAECQEGNYDLMIIGSAEEILAPDQIFGRLDDYLMEVVPCSMMVVRPTKPAERCGCVNRSNALNNRLPAIQAHRRGDACVASTKQLHSILPDYCGRSVVDTPTDQTYRTITAEIQAHRRGDACVAST